VIETQMGESHDLVFGQICRLLDVWMARKIAGRSDHNVPDVATEADRNERRIRQMANAQSNIDAFLHQVDLAAAK